jgi:hypothetical protein
MIDLPQLMTRADVATALQLVVFVSLEDRAASINDHINKALRADGTGHRLRLKAGNELIEVRDLLPHGEWLPWCKANIHRGVRDVQKLIKMASADDPEAALEKERAEAREGMAATRANAPNVRRISDAKAEKPDGGALIGKFKPLGPRIRNTVSVPEKPHGETRLQKAKRLFLHFAREDVDVCNKIMRDLPFDPVDDISDLRAATRTVIEIWEKIDAALAKRAAEQPPAVAA